MRCLIYALELMNKEDLVFTAPKEESLKEYEKQGIKTAILSIPSYSL